MLLAGALFTAFRLAAFALASAVIIRLLVVEPEESPPG